jgi:drug/metabolite transporter (DMT)-like permease
MSGFAKFLGEDGYNSLRVSWARAFGHIVFMLAVFVPRFGFGMLRTRRPAIQLTHSAMLFTSNATNFFVPPSQYRQLIGSVTVGYVLFGDFRDLLTWIGAAVIVGSGVYIGWSQTRTRS